MNKLVQSWDKYQRRIAGSQDVQDAIEVEETKVPILEDPMAVRQRYEKDIALEKHQFNNTIRMLHRLTFDGVKAVRAETYNQLKRLGLKRDETEAIFKIPKGSDQVDTGSLFTWMNKIDPGDGKDAKAKNQLIAIDATAVARTSGD